MMRKKRGDRGKREKDREGRQDERGCDGELERARALAEQASPRGSNTAYHYRDINIDCSYSLSLEL